MAPTRSRAADLVRRGLVSVAGVTALKPGVAGGRRCRARGQPRGAALRFPRRPQARGGARCLRLRPQRTSSARYRRLDRGLYRRADRPRSGQNLCRRCRPRTSSTPSSGSNPRVIALEGTDARALDRQVIGEEVTAIVADVSFIGFTWRCPPRSKPRRARRLAGGAHQAAIRGRAGGGRQRRHCAKTYRPREGGREGARIHRGDAGWTVVGEIVSPILGGSGNEEFLIGARHGA